MPGPGMFFYNMTIFATQTNRKKKSNMTHGHEVLEMMFGNSYASAEELIEAIIAKFGPDERFYTCSAEDMTAAELVAFLQERGKFMPAGHDGFTADRSRMCNHEH